MKRVLLGFVIGVPVFLVLLLLLFLANPGLFIDGPRPSPRTVGATALRSGIHEAQQIFKERLIVDQNENQIGEYGLLSDMTSDTMPLLPPFLKGKNPEYDYFYFALYLPDGKGGAFNEAPRVKSDEAARMQELYYIAYAWPKDTNEGRTLMFAISSDGILRAKEFTGQAPIWSDALKDGRWDGGMLWERFRK